VTGTQPEASQRRPRYVDVYGADHSPWVQAVLLGLFEAGIEHRLRSLPTMETFLASGVRMPAASIDGGDWQLESADILKALGFAEVDRDDYRMVNRTWQGVVHRPDSIALFWGAFSLAGDRNSARLKRLASNFFRSFIPFYMYLLIKTLSFSSRLKDPDNFGDQFVPLEERLAAQDGRFLSGDSPDSLDFLAFGIIQCHCSVYVPPVTALQTDPRLDRVRDWIGAMQERFCGYRHLYSGTCFPPFAPPPTWASKLDRAAFWLGLGVMIALFPLTVPLVAFLAIRPRIQKG